MDKILRIKELVSVLNKARDTYYNQSGEVMSNYEYDTLFDELHMLENETKFVLSSSPTQTVGYTVNSKLKKIKHGHPMLSLDKTKLVNELMDFIAGYDTVIMHKLDGLTISIEYDESGDLISAETRGNGEEGEDITDNVRFFKNVPLHINHIGGLVVDGEAIITYSDFELINSKLADTDKYKNPRNLASGSVRQLDSSVTAKRNVNFIAWKCISGLDNNSHSDRLEILSSLGFTIVDYIRLPEGTNSIDHAIKVLKDLANEKGMPIDGLVVGYDDIAYGESLGSTGHHIRSQIAFKFYDEEVESNIIGIEWSMGKTGSLNPVAIFEPVEIDGTEVERASLHNVSILEDLKIGLGDTVLVYKANQIIPQIRENLTKTNNVIIPRTCPICGGDTFILKENDSKVLMCGNEECSGKLLGRLNNFVSKNAMNMDGLSDATLDFLINKKWVSSFIDLFHLSEHKSEWEKEPGFGKRSVEKTLSCIEESRNVKLENLLPALSIPLIGRSASKDISKYCSGDVLSFVELMERKHAFSHYINGFGDAMQISIVLWWETHKNLFMNLLDEITVIKDMAATSSAKDTLNGKTFVITGSLLIHKNRDELVLKIESYGGKVSGSVSKTTDYLINNDLLSTSGKNKKANELGVKIISEQQLVELFE